MKKLTILLVAAAVDEVLPVALEPESCSVLEAADWINLVPMV